MAATAAFRPPTPKPPTTGLLDASRPAHDLAPGFRHADLRPDITFAVA